MRSGFQRRSVGQTVQLAIGAESWAGSKGPSSVAGRRVFNRAPETLQVIREVSMIVVLTHGYVHLIGKEVGIHCSPLRQRKMGNVARTTEVQHFPKEVQKVLFLQVGAQKKKRTRTVHFSEAPAE